MYVIQLCTVTLYDEVKLAPWEHDPTLKKRWFNVLTLTQRWSNADSSHAQWHKTVDMETKNLYKQSQGLFLRNIMPLQHDDDQCYVAFYPTDW